MARQQLAALEMMLSSYSILIVILLFFLFCEKNPNPIDLATVPVINLLAPRQGPSRAAGEAVFLRFFNGGPCAGGVKNQANPPPSSVIHKVNVKRL